VSRKKRNVGTTNPGHSQPRITNTLFCYRFRKLQHQLIGVGSFGGSHVTTDIVEWRLLAKLGVLETDLEKLILIPYV
jgi:hypothetical protein